jgi:ElaB/YqjD/DUF883 family membrane-anchored ribosome-binding protein
MSDDFKKRIDDAMATLRECQEAISRYEITDSDKDLTEIRAKAAEALQQVKTLRNRWTQ